MSFLSDLFEGHTSNLGNDLAPSNIFSDFGSDAKKVLSNPLDDALIAGTILTGGLLAPELLGADAAIGAADAAGSIAGADATLGAADASAGALGFAGDATAAGTDASLTSFLADPAATAAGAGSTAASAGSTGALSLTAPAAGTDITAATAAGGWPAGLDLSGGTLGTGAAADAGAGAPLSLTSAATGGTGGAVTAAGTAAGTTDPSLLATIGGYAKTAAPIAGLGGLGYNLYSGYETKKAQQAETNQINATAAQEAAISTQDTNSAQPLIASGTALTQYLTTNTLPPQFAQQITSLTQAQKAQVIQGYATRGQSTDPTHNSALAQDLANVDNQAATLQASLESTLATAGNQMVSTANQLLASGASAAEISGQLPIQVAQLNNTLNTATSNAIANFAAALGGGKINSTSGQPGQASGFNVAVNTNNNSQQPLSFGQ